MKWCLTAAKLKYAIEQHSTEIRTLSEEPSDESVGELVYFDTGNYDPNSVGTDHYAITTAQARQELMCLGCKVTERG
jgi:hypothetical protein